MSCRRIELGPPSLLDVTWRSRVLRLLAQPPCLSLREGRGPPIVQSCELREVWLWCYIDELALLVEDTPSLSYV